MPYHYLDNVALADIAFHAQGKSLDELFVSCADATMNVMVEELESVAAHCNRPVTLKDDSMEMLLFQFLQELIYYKDAEKLFLRVKQVHVREEKGMFYLTGEFCGEELDSQKHKFSTDVKAVTLHLFQVAQTPKGWEATVTLDV